MSLEHYQALLKLTLGVSTFIIMLLALRLLSELKRERKLVANTGEKWRHKEQLLIADILEETHDIKTFVFKRQHGARFPEFKAGQFLSLQIREDAKQMRSYSISSSAESRQTIRVSIKRLSGGIGSEWLHSLKIGDQVWAYPPSGHFSESELKTKQRIYLAGGIGMTPMLSMILTNLERAADVEMHVFYGMRSQKDMAFHAQLSELARKHKSLNYYPVVSHDSDWPGDKGFLSLDFIKSKVAFEPETAFFICGPDPMANALMNSLSQIGHNEELIFNEQFVSPTTFDPSQIPVREVNVSWNGRPLHYRGNQSLLEFLEDQGEFIPYACRTGVCGTCKCRIKGDVHVLTTSGLKRDEVKQGLALTCVAYPTGDLEIEAV